MKGRILIGITGSIAAYKSCDLISKLRQLGYEVRAILTEHAKNFVTPTSITTLCQHPVYDDNSGFSGSNHIEHIALARWADLVCVAPATANFMTKYAYGIADNLLLTELLAYTRHVMLAPAMNHSMYASPQVKTAIELLDKLDVTWIKPQYGQLACGETGWGKMADVADIINTIEQHFQSNRVLQGKKVIITAGATRAYIDPVRYISNPASGLMGFALAHAAKQMGADVHLIAGPHDSSLNFDNCHTVETATAMHDAVISALPGTDLFIAAAAVNDYQPKSPSPRKLDLATLSSAIEWEQSPDIVAAVSQHPHRPKIVIGFAAQTHEHEIRAKEKLIRKKLDYIVMNHVENGLGFAQNENEVWIYAADKQTLHLAKQSKMDLATNILNWIYADHQNHKSLPPTTAQL